MNLGSVTSIIIDIGLFFSLYFQIFLLVTFFEMDDKARKIERAREAHYKDENVWPTVSVLVPCFNEEKTVVKTIQSLLALDYPKDKLSILVVDDGSTDNTRARAMEFIATLPTKSVHIVTQKNGGKFTALNFGIQQSTAEFICCLDADSTVSPEALKRMIPFFADENVMAVTPAMLVTNAQTLLQKMQRVEYNIGIFIKRVLGYLDAIYVTPGPFSVFRRSIFDKIGLFKHAHNTEDMEIAFRMQSAGYKIANCVNAFVYTNTPRTLKTLYKQRTRWSYGFFKNSFDYRHMFFNKKYGNLGLLTLPSYIIAIFFAFFTVGNMLYTNARSIVESIDRIRTVGIHFHALSWPTFNWFFINTNITTFLALILFGLGLFVIFMSKKMAEQNMKPTVDILYFILLYSFIAPLWLGKALYNVVLSKHTPWR